MKKNFLLLSVLLLALLTVSSCSNSKMNDLLDQIPEDMDIVFVGNVKTVLESAGGSIKDDKIVLPSFITNEMSANAEKKLNEVNDILKHSGLDPDAIAVFGNFDYSVPIVLFSITDNKKFVAAIEDEGYDEKDSNDGMVIYSKKVYEGSSSEYDNYSYLAVKDSYAYFIECVWVGSKFKPNKTLERIVEDAKESPFGASKFADYVTSGNAFGVCIRLPHELHTEMKEMGVSSTVLDLYNGVVCMQGSLENDKMSINLKMFDKDGKAIDLKGLEDIFDFKAKISSGSLAYLGKNEQLVMAISLKDMDWDKYLNACVGMTGISRSDQAKLPLVKSYLEKLDGTVAIGMGINNGLESVFSLATGKNMLQQMAVTVVIETKDGQAAGVVKDLKGLLDSTETSYKQTKNGMTLNIPGQNASIYINAEGNNIVISNNEIRKGSDNSAVKAFDFTDDLGAMAIYFNKDNKLFKDLKIDNDVLLTVSSNVEDFESSLRLEIKGGDTKGIIAKIAKIVTDIIAQKDDLNARLEEFYEQSYKAGYHEYGDVADEVLEDTVVVEEVSGY